MQHALPPLLRTKEVPLSVSAARDGKAHLIRARCVGHGSSISCIHYRSETLAAWRNHTRPTPTAISAPTGLSTHSPRLGRNRLMRSRADTGTRIRHFDAVGAGLQHDKRTNLYWSTERAHAFNSKIAARTFFPGHAARRMQMKPTAQDGSGDTGQPPPAKPYGPPSEKSDRPARARWDKWYGAQKAPHAVGNNDTDRLPNQRPG